MGEDAMNKLSKASPAVQQTAMRDFNPKDAVQGIDLSGKFIMFVAMLERTEAGRSYSQKGMDKGKGKGMDMGFKGMPMVKGMSKGMGMGKDKGYGKYDSYGASMDNMMWNMMTKSASKDKGKSKGGKSSGKNLVFDGTPDQFLQHWNLNADAAGKLYKLTPSVQKMVMNQFDPPVSNQDLSGKFIMFASSLEKAHAGSASDSLSEFVRYWGLNEDAQNKLYKLSPDVAQLVMEKFAPPMTGRDVSGKFIMFAASIEHPKGEGRGVKRPREEQWPVQWPGQQWAGAW